MVIRDQRHMVIFYRDDYEFTEQVSEFLRSAIDSSGSSIMIGSPAHRALVESRLAGAGIDLAARSAQGRHLALDAAQTLRRFLVAGWPDPGGFWRTITPLIEPVAASGRPVAIFGEMVGQLWEAGSASAALELEALWNEVVAEYTISLLCGYAASSVAGSYHQTALARLRRLHEVATER